MVYKVYVSDSYDPRVNLAYEEYFLNRVGEEEIILFFWQSKNAVVVGRNQNPYQECNLSKMSEDQVIMVRRLSGGGAVYHDLGNLNYSFIAAKALYDTDQFYNIILASLKDLGIQGEKSGRNDLIHGGRKFSGNAFIEEEKASLHHGTLLVKSDILKLKNYLTVNHEKLATKGFDSVGARVINLSEIKDSISIESLIGAFVDRIRKSHELTLATLPDKEFADLYMAKYFSHKWNYGDFPDFDVAIDKKYEWGLISIQFKVVDGIINNLRIATDSLLTEAFHKLRDELSRHILTLDEVSRIIRHVFSDQAIISDLIGAFEEALFI